MRSVCVIGAVVALTCGSAYCGVLSHWRFDEATGPTVSDSAGAMVGTLSGDAVLRPGMGVSGGAIEFPVGMTGLVNMGDIYPFTSGESFTLSAWVRAATDQTSEVRVPVARHYGGFVNGYFLALNQSGGYGAPGFAYLYANHGTGGEARSTTVVTDMEWHHLVGVVQGGSPSIWVDGAPVEGTGFNTVITDGGAEFIIGGLTTSSGPTPLFEGLVDDVQVYDIALAAWEIQFLFENPGETVCRGDVDGDRGVTFADLNIVLENWGVAVAAGTGGDLDHSGTVNFADLNIVLDNWGQLCP